MKYSGSLRDVVEVVAPIEGFVEEVEGEKENGLEGMRRVNRSVFGGREGKALGCSDTNHSVRAKHYISNR